ncbi:hypothetical protein [Nonomuraea typhae]|uniref:Uncharacterized protein n=1 Tax=Nonomuraea typhae TaxID=2603600 RepID=A0ABW7YWT9_9ACTN
MVPAYRAQRRYAKPFTCSDRASARRQIEDVIDGFTVTRKESGLRAVHDRSGYDVFVPGEDLEKLRRRATELGALMERIYARQEHVSGLCRLCRIRVVMGGAAWSLEAVS